MINITAILTMFGIATILGILLVLADHFFSNYGRCKIIINNDMEFLVEGGNSLLASLFDNKIFIPSACGGKATCGFCKISVIEGGGEILPTERPFLTRADLSHNVRLACQIKVKSDISVIIPNEYLAINEFTAEVIGIVELNYDTKEITLKLKEPQTASFRPGQYIQFRVPDTAEYRAYSIASVPSQKDIVKLIVRLVPGGICSTYIHKSLNIGDEISFTGPFGEFYLQEESTNDIICIAGGCGMAPFRSIIYHLLEIGSSRNITFYFGAKAKKDLYYIEEFDKLSERYPNFRFIVALSEPKKEDQWTGEVGFIHQIVDKNIDNIQDKEAYLCGPPPMIDATINVLLSRGFRQENIYFDKFS